MEDDATLLRQYAEERSDQAFAELVRRHVNLVYSAALRQVGGDAHLAQDVAQSVFTDLARKAAAVARCPVLAGWLHTSTHYAAAKAVRSEQRRHRREQQAHAMQELLNPSAHDAEWSRLRPVLDVAIKELSPEDRDAILLRFFEGNAFGVIGARFHLTENAARMRVERALDKLRAQLTRVGINSTSAALASVLATQAVTAAPASLAFSVTNAALVSAAASGAVGSVLSFMAITKTQVAVVGAILLAGGSAVVSQRKTQHELQTEISHHQVSAAEISQLRETIAQLARANAEREALQSSSAGLESLRAEIQALREHARAASLAAAARDASAPSAGKSVRPPSPEELNAMKTIDRVPEIKHRVAPVFPVAMRNAGISGEALVEIIVDASGKVNGAFAVTSTHRDFEEPALEAVRQWSYDPGRKRGRAVNTRMQIPIVFALPPNEPDWF